MRWRLLAFGSLGVNCVLVLVLFFEFRSLHPRHTDQAYAAAATTSPNSQTNVLLRRQYFKWREVESDDYPAYIANLRDIGCPEQTVRDIIIADVNSMYAKRRATELVTSGQQWWRSDPDSNVVQAAQIKAQLLEDERHALLGRLLGTNWEAADMVSLPRPSRPGVLLDGSILGNLPLETKQAVQDINLRSQDALLAYLETKRKEGRPPDVAELARLRAQTRLELEKTLSPPQLEEYLLRYSQNANNWRTEYGQLKYFNPSADEFRSVFRATDSLEGQIQLLADVTDPALVTQRKALESQREAAIKNALGDKRYQEYRLLQDPEYRNAVAQAQAAGTPEAAGLIYEINQETLAEQERIRTDPSLTDSQKAIELKKIELEQLKANTVASGQELPPEPPAASTPATGPRKLHVIRPGDSVALVAMLYGVPPSALRAANPNVDFGRLRAGDTLSLPPRGNPPVPAPPPP